MNHRLPFLIWILCIQAVLFGDAPKDITPGAAKCALVGYVDDGGWTRIEAIQEDQIAARNLELTREYEKKTVHPMLKILSAGKTQWEAEAALSSLVERARGQKLAPVFKWFSEQDQPRYEIPNAWDAVLKIVQEMAKEVDAAKVRVGMPLRPAVDRPKGPAGYPPAVMCLNIAGREGLGVLVSRAGDAGILVTTARLASAAEKGEAFLRSGGTSLSAKVLEVDWHFGLAALSVSGAGLPEPLAVDSGVMAEPESELLAPSGTAKAGKLLKGADGENRAFAASGAFRRDERGGALLKADGHLAGILSDHLVPGRSAMALLPGEVAAFLAGRPLGLLLELPPKCGGETRSRYKATLTLSNPAGIIQGVDVDVCRSDACSDRKGLCQNGQWKQMEKPLRTAHLTIGKNGMVATGEVEFLRTPKDPMLVPFLCQVVRQLKGGETIAGEPVEVNAQFLIPSHVGYGDGGAPIRKELPVPPALPKGIDPLLPDVLEPSISMPMKAVIGDLCLSPSGDFLFALDSSASRIVKVRTADLQLVGEAKLDSNATCMALSPDGMRLGVGFLVQGANGARTGALQAFSADDLKRQSSVGLPNSPAQLMFSLPGSLLYVVSDYVPERTVKLREGYQSEWDASIVVNIQGGQVWTSQRISQHEFEDFQLLPYPDPRRRQCWACNSGGAAWSVFQMESARNAEPMGDRHGEGVVTPDQKWRLVPPRKNWDALPELPSDLKPTGPAISRACSMTADPAWDAVLFSMPGGALRVYSASTSALLRDYQLKNALSWMCLDPVSGRLYAVQTEPTPEQKRNAHVPLSPADVRARIGTLVVYSLGQAK